MKNSNVISTSGYIMKNFLNTTKLLLLYILCLLTIQANAGAILSNGTVSIGVNDQGDLIYSGVGLRYIPTNGEALAPGCDCEGWGVADITSRAFAKSGRAFGTQNVVVESFESDSESVTSVVTAAGIMRVTHDYRSSNSENLFRNLVTIENISSETIDLRYRRAMDWDVPPTTFSEMVTIVTNGASKVFATSDNGFMDGNPLTPITRIRFFGEAVDDGPADHGAVFDFAFGELAPGETTEFVIYYGASTNESEALDALSIVGAEVYSLGKPNPSNPAVSTDGTPNTFIFGFGGVGGTPIIRPLPDYTLGGFKVIDNGEGAPVDLEVRVANAGMENSEVPDVVNVSFFDGDPETGGALIGVRAIAGLDIGRYQDVRLEGVSGISNAELVAVIDYEQQISECRETNNEHRIPFVSTTPRGNISVSSDNAVYTTNQVAALSGTIANTGLFDYSLNAQLIVETASGETVETFSQETLGVINSGQSNNIEAVWNTAGFVAGVYRVRGVLTDDNGIIISESIANFRLDHDFAASPAASIRVSSDKQEYHVTDSVQLASIYQNLTDNVYIQNAHVELTVTDSGGEFILQESVTVPSLAPSQLAELSRPLDLTKAPTGTYTIYAALVTSSGEVYAEDTATFTVLNDSLQSLDGSVEAQLNTLFVGETQTCQFFVQNTGTATLENIPLIKRLVNVDDQIEASKHETSLSLVPDNTSNSIDGFGTGGLAAGNYACTLQAIVDGQEIDLAFDQFVLEVPPIILETTGGAGGKGRALILVDPAATTDSSCQAVSQLEIQLTPERLIAPQDELLLELYNGQGGLLDSETLVAGHYVQPVNDNIATITDLVIVGVTADSLALRLQSGVTGQSLNGEAHRVVISHAQLSGTVQYDSGLIGTACADAVIDHLLTDNMVITDVQGEDIDDPYEPNLPTNLEQRRFIESLLQQAGWSYTIVDNAEDYASELHSGGYTVTGLFNEQLKLPESLQGELVQAVEKGLGLVYAGYHDSRNGRIEPALGIKSAGKLPKVDGLLLNPSVLQPDAATLVLNADAKPLKVRLEGAESVAVFTTNKGEKTAITRYDYGSGRSVYMGFDLLVEATNSGQQSNYASLLLQALSYVDPEPQLLVGRTLPVSLSIQNRGIAVTGQVVLSIPANAMVVDSGKAHLLNDTQLVWPFALETNALQLLVFWLQLPEAAGEMIVSGNIAVYDSNNQLIDYGPIDLLLNVTEQ